MTHTYALLEVSPMAYAEIHGKLTEAGYQHAFDNEGTIDMHGIAVVKSAGDMIQLFDVNYSMEMFRQFAFAPIGAAFRIVGRDLGAGRGTVTVEKLVEDEGRGWVIDNGKDGEGTKRFRFMNDDGCVAWTPDVDQALRFARRQDAESFSAQDEDAWCITPYVYHVDSTTKGTSMHVHISTTGIKAEVLQRLKEPGSAGTLSDGPGIAPPNELETKIRDAIAEHIQTHAGENGNVRVTASISLTYPKANSPGEHEHTPTPADASQADGNKARDQTPVSQPSDKDDPSLV